MFSVLVPAVLAVLPLGYELDFDALPPAQPKGFNEYTVVLSFKGEPAVKIPIGIARKFGPTGAADFFMEGMDDTRWKLKREGNRVTVLGYDDVRTAKIVVEGNGPKPLVRRVPLLPEKKK